MRPFQNQDILLMPYRSRRSGPPWLSPLLFLLFFCSGFCSLVYQVVWLRLAFAHFGIVTPVLSVVLSVFMLGLGAGSLLAGRWGPVLAQRLKVSPAALYGCAELIIALGAPAVPALFALGERLLLQVGAASSAEYLALSAAAITLTILPWCLMMGATFPLMMTFVRARDRRRAESFSFLYLANVIGAMTGCVASALVLIELLGFAGTTLVAAGLNAAIAVVSFVLAAVFRKDLVTADAAVQPLKRGDATRWREIILFTTGFCSLAMEVVWVRGFTIILKTTIYAFAAILATYLLATWIGSAAYRLAIRQGRVLADSTLLAIAAATALLPVVLNDPRLQSSWAGVLFSIAPFCATLGYLTPKMVDDYAGGDPRLAGRSYAINILGGILGPLFAGYILVVEVSTRYALLALSLPLGVLAIAAAWRNAPRATSDLAWIAPAALLLLAGVGISQSYEDLAGRGGPRETHRDHVATAIAFGEGRDRNLLVNGVGITSLTPLTKVMAHLPLALHGKARDALVICFGMGTTFRSMVSWGVDTTAVDLTRSVVDSFGFFHADAAEVTARPNAHVIVDDGRRFLLRTDKDFDVIVLDPPPPPSAAGSSLLYSVEFYEVARRHLRPHGILQQWVPPQADADTMEAMLRSLQAVFPHLAVYQQIESSALRRGLHFIASMDPIPDLTPEEFVARLPPAAQQDLVEWGPGKTPLEMAALILGSRAPASDVVASPPSALSITDDRPFNEYYLLRKRPPWLWFR
jgi:predicted membrane-bound spermidine synthase